MSTQNKAKVTISKRGNHAGSGVFNIEIEDAASGITIVEVEMELAQFAECIGGLGNVEANIKMLPNEYTTQRYGKKKSVSRVFCDKVSSSKEIQRDAVEKHFSENFETMGWEMWSDGCTTQQHGDLHEYVIMMYGASEQHLAAFDAKFGGK